MITHSTLLGGTARADALARLAATTPAAPLDVLIVGGGVTGLGAALDAASRGLSTGLIEMRDYSSGASSHSSRLAHGGLRYLEHGEVGLVHEALRERQLILSTIAPTLSRPVDFLLPATSRAQLAYFRVGVAGYDVLARALGDFRHGPKSRILGRKGLEAEGLGLATRFVGAVGFTDGQLDDARHTVALARTAQGYGAAVANYARCIEAIPSNEIESEGLVRVRIEADGTEFDAWARSVVWATGAWSNQLAAQAGGPLVRPSKGTHIVVPREAIDLSCAVISRTAKSVLFILPWADTWIIGTTDDDYPGDPSTVEVTEAEIEYLLAETNKVVRIPLTRASVIASYAGLRPLAVERKAGSSTSVSREHLIERIGASQFAIVGGKYTTYRVMAKDVIDEVCAARSLTLPCVTDRIPVVVEGSADAIGNFTWAGAQATDEAQFEAAITAAIEVDGARTVDDVLTRRLRVTTNSTALAARLRSIAERQLQAAGL